MRASADNGFYADEVLGDDVDEDTFSRKKRLDVQSDLQIIGTIDVWELQFGISSLYHRIRVVTRVI